MPCVLKAIQEILDKLVIKIYRLSNEVMETA